MISSIVRSVAIASVFIPVSLGLTGGINRLLDKAEITTAKATQLAQMKSDLAKDCVAWMMSKKDTKVERQAEIAIDEYFNGSVDYKSICDWALN